MVRPGSTWRGFHEPLSWWAETRRRLRATPSGSVVRHTLCSATELFRLVSSWLREWQPAAPINEVTVELLELHAASRRQLRLWIGGDGSAEEVEAALERLQERYGDAAVLLAQLAFPTSPLPEQRFALTPA